MGNSLDIVVEPWRPLFDLAAQSYYSGDLDTGRWACECLLSLQDVPEIMRARVRCNQIFYTPLLPALAPRTRIRPILFEVSPLWSRFNPTIAVDGSGYRLVVRSSNFNTDIGDPYYRVFSPDGVFRTVNYAVHLDDDLAVCQAKLIQDQTNLAGELGCQIADVGFTDCRLFQWRGSWHVSASVLDGCPGSVIQIGLLRLQGDAFQDLRVLSDVSTRRDEKNWMPFTHEEDLLFVYTCSPTVVLRYNKGRVEEFANQPAPVIARDFRGGSQGIEVDDGYLFIVHEAVPLDNGTRAYPHRFILMDQTCRITRVSPPFFFLHRFKEFCCGMARRDDQLVISFGFLNREAFVAQTPLREVLATLRPVYG